MKCITSIRRVGLPIIVFMATGVFHYIWLGLFPETNPLQDQWLVVEAVPPISWLQRYTETQSYYLGFSYAVALAFASVALRRYREERYCATRNLAIGGISFSGFLAVAGCYLLGCCGSPMLAVYLSIFGATFLPLAKPLIAILTITFIALSWWSMNRLKNNALSSPQNYENTHNSD